MHFTIAAFEGPCMLAMRDAAERAESNRLRAFTKLKTGQDLDHVVLFIETQGMIDARPAANTP